MGPTVTPGAGHPAGQAGSAHPTDSGVPWTDGWTMAATALVIAGGVLLRTEWAMARQEPLRQRCRFVVTMLAVGARLWALRIAAARPFARRVGNGSAPSKGPGRPGPQADQRRRAGPD